MTWQNAFLLLFAVWTCLVTWTLLILSRKIHGIERAWEDNIPKLWEKSIANFNHWQESRRRLDEEIRSLRKDIATGKDLDPLRFWGDKK